MISADTMMADDSIDEVSFWYQMIHGCVEEEKAVSPLCLQYFSYKYLTMLYNLSLH
jgi:hypothetical protein